MSWRAAIFGLLLGLAGASTLYGQDTPPDQPEEKVVTDPMPTLHVYLDLIQIPVLVLDGELQRMKPIAPEKFVVSLDSGPLFHPKHVRQEGDDPISLAILLDLNAEPDLMPEIGSAIARLAPRSLASKDHVTVYALDCSLVRAVADLPADDARLRAALDTTLQTWKMRRKEKHPATCAGPVHLWDAMGIAVKELSELPGRRVLLAVTDGVDNGSRMASSSLRAYAQWKSVAVFGYTHKRSGQTTQMHGSSGRGMRDFPVDAHAQTTEDPFDSICELSGGMIMNADAQFEAQQMARFVAMVRERYILEFTRPRNDAPGEHDIQVTLLKSSPTAYIRPAGVTIMMPDASRYQDPTTAPRDLTDAPELGTRRPLKPN